MSDAPVTVLSFVLAIPGSIALMVTGMFLGMAAGVIWVQVVANFLSGVGKMFHG